MILAKIEAYAGERRAPYTYVIATAACRRIRILRASSIIPSPLSIKTAVCGSTVSEAGADAVPKARLSITRNSLPIPGLPMMSTVVKGVVDVTPKKVLP